MFQSVPVALDSIEREIMTLIWNVGPQTGRDILIALRQHHTLAQAKVTATLARLVDRGLLERSNQHVTSRQSVWRYVPRYPSRGAFLAAALEQICMSIDAGPSDRAEALAVILGARQ